jgi:hypothetical protein
MTPAECSPPARVEWAMGKGYAEPAGKGCQLRLTEPAGQRLAFFRLRPYASAQG